MLKKFALPVVGILVVLFVALSIVVALQPEGYEVQRSVMIAAPAAEVFSQVNDFQAWGKWTPWKVEDPNPKLLKTSEPSFGKGATFSWSGNEKIGEGTLTIVESKANERVELEQEFVRPMAGKCRMAFELQPEGEKTKLTWKVHGQNGFVGKAVCLLMDMDECLGPNLEKGLASIQREAEVVKPEPAATESAAPVPPAGN